jgi:transcriptional regulator with XRE-family HTH domain
MDFVLNNIKIEILKKFPTQADFAQAARISESHVSRVLRGRKKLNGDELEIWERVLRCDPKVLEGVTRQ